MKWPYPGKKQEEKDAWECGLGGWIKERYYIQWIPWIIQASGYSLSFLLTEVYTGGVWCHLIAARTLARSTFCESEDTMDKVVDDFWANWCDGGEWMGKQKSWTWHLAVITALWPRLVQCWVGHMNNKPTAEPLWLAGDVLHSHHPSQTGDHWWEWISLLKLVTLNHEKTRYFNTMTSFQFCLIYQKRMYYIIIPVLVNGCFLFS